MLQRLGGQGAHEIDEVAAANVASCHPAANSLGPYNGKGMMLQQEEFWVQCFCINRSICLIILPQPGVSQMLLHYHSHPSQHHTAILAGVGERGGPKHLESNTRLEVAAFDLFNSNKNVVCPEMEGSNITSEY